MPQPEADRYADSARANCNGLDRRRLAAVGLAIVHGIDRVGITATKAKAASPCVCAQLNPCDLQRIPIGTAATFARTAAATIHGAARQDAALRRSNAASSLGMIELLLGITVPGD